MGYNVIAESTLRYMGSKKFIIETRSLLDLIQKIFLWTTIGNTGACIWGAARIGKTHSLEYIKRRLFEKYGESFPVIIWTFNEHSNTEKSFYVSLLQALGLTVKERSAAIFQKERVLHALSALATETQLRKCILLIDEAGKMSREDFLRLMDLYNKLSISDIQLTCFMFGTNELHTLKEFFKERDDNQILGRFMDNEEHFFGLRSVEELAICLIRLDETMIVDESLNPGTMLIRDYFFPDADDRTFYSLSKEYWNAFQTVRSQSGITAEEIPMKYMMASFLICLNSYGAYGNNPVCFPTAEELIDCIRLSKYSEWNG